MRNHLLLTCAAVVLLSPAGLRAQDTQEPPRETAAIEPAKMDKRAYGVLPNYRAADGMAPFVPITTAQKYGIGLRDSFDKPVYLLAAFYAGISQYQDSNPSFGQGMQGFGRRYVRSLGDAAIGNLLTEAVFSSAFHEDPRYFVQSKASGGVGHRLWYAVTRVVVTRTDSGTNRFNFSEFAGNASSVAISNAYYPESRTVSDNLTKLGVQVGTDAISNVLKEFWPDVKQRFFTRRGTR